MNKLSSACCGEPITAYDRCSGCGEPAEPPTLADGRTHWEGCWQDRKHHSCALEQIRTLTAQLAERDWISVSERGPAPGQQVLTLDSRGEYAIDWIENMHDGLEWMGDSSFIPTHWQPLPAPPTGGSNDDK